MKPTKYCDNISCADCLYYKKCTEKKIEENIFKGKSLPEIKIIAIKKENY